MTENTCRDRRDKIAGCLLGMAIVDALGVPREGLPPSRAEKMFGAVEWPRSVDWIDALADRLSRQFPDSGTGNWFGPQALFWPGQLLRNLLFAIIVMTHGFRRLLPPY